MAACGSSCARRHAVYRTRPQTSDGRRHSARRTDPLEGPRGNTAVHAQQRHAGRPKPRIPARQSPSHCAPVCSMLQMRDRIASIAAQVDRLRLIRFSPARRSSAPSTSPPVTRACKGQKPMCLLVGKASSHPPAGHQRPGARGGSAATRRRAERAPGLWHRWAGRTWGTLRPQLPHASSAPRQGGLPPSPLPYLTS